MKRWLPHPLLACLLLLTWVVLQQSLAPRTFIFGALLAIILCLVLERLHPCPVRVRHVGTLARLMACVWSDILRSNIAVAKLVLWRRKPLTSGFVSIPLDITNPYALATLACIITSTPGTAWVSHDSRQRLLVIHVLDLVDENVWIRTIKQRYEQRLLEIFQ